MGAAMYAADRRTSSMHGKQFVLDAIYAGINENSLSARADFAQGLGSESLEIRVHVDVVRAKEKHTFRLDVVVNDGRMISWSLIEENGAERQRARSDGLTAGVDVALEKILEVRLPFTLLGVRNADEIKLRFSVWRDRLPIDALPLEGSIELDVIPEEALAANAYAR
jgi:hypothetical protein